MARSTLTPVQLGIVEVDVPGELEVWVVLGERIKLRSREAEEEARTGLTRCREEQPLAVVVIRYNKLRLTYHLPEV